MASRGPCPQNETPAEKPRQRVEKIGRINMWTTMHLYRRRGRCIPHGNAEKGSASSDTTSYHQGRRIDSRIKYRRANEVPRKRARSCDTLDARAATFVSAQRFLSNFSTLSCSQIETCVSL